MLLLASQSPRRAELLKQLEIPFKAHNVSIDETVRPNEGSDDYVVRLAKEKAIAGMSCAAEFNSMEFNSVLGADTVVVVNQSPDISNDCISKKETILGKPTDFEHAKSMWRLLAVGPHEVKTAVAVVTPEQELHCLVTTKVWFKSLSDAEMLWYWRTGEPRDKAGGYGIQGLAGQFISRIEGSYSAVVGLPLYETSKLINQVEVSKYER